MPLTEGQPGCTIELASGDTFTGVEQVIDKLLLDAEWNLALPRLASRSFLAVTMAPRPMTALPSLTTRCRRA